jgi:hypothetical protein
LVAGVTLNLNENGWAGCQRYLDTQKQAMASDKKCRDHLHPFNELMYIPAP